jgi:hypothetical protein
MTTTTAPDETKAVAAPGEDNGPEASPAEARDAKRLFKFSDEVHIGPDAKDCPDKSNGSCENAEHFHAFIRLPNQFQHASLREKADAARARRLRQLRDPDSDSSVILDVELEEIRRNAGHEALVEEVVGFDFLKDHLAAMNEVGEQEEFEHIEEDRERLRALAKLPDDEVPQEEFKELEAHLVKYTEAVNAARTAIQEPLRSSLMDRGVDDLLDLIREERVQKIAEEDATNVFSQWEWYIGTLKMRVPEKVNAEQQRVFPSIDAMKAAAPEIIEALAEGFREIEAAAGRSLQEAAAR